MPQVVQPHVQCGRREGNSGCRCIVQSGEREEDERDSRYEWQEQISIRVTIPLPVYRITLGFIPYEGFME